MGEKGTKGTEALESAKPRKAEKPKGKKAKKGREVHRIISTKMDDGTVHHEHHFKQADGSPDYQTSQFTSPSADDAGTHVAEAMGGGQDQGGGDDEAAAEAMGGGGAPAGGAPAGE